MKPLAILAVAVLLSACATPAPAQPTPAPTCEPASIGADADEVRRLERRGADSNVQGWSIEEARDFFAPEWVSVQPDGSVVGLDGIWSQFSDGRSRPWASRFNLPELDVRVYCDVAVVIGVGEAWAPGAAADAPPAVRFRFTNVWRKQGGRWLYAANQYARY